MAGRSEKKHEHAYIPHLRITVEPIEVGSGCAGILRGELVADVSPTRIIATKKEVSGPTVVIWVYDDTFRGPQQGFSEFMISRGEGLIKTLVNSWTEFAKKELAHAPVVRMGLRCQSSAMGPGLTRRADAMG